MTTSVYTPRQLRQKLRADRDALDDGDTSMALALIKSAGIVLAIGVITTTALQLALGHL